MKTKNLLLLIAFVALSSFAFSQDKYEFMIIEYDAFKNNITASVNGKEFLKKDGEHDGQKKSGYNANPLLKVVNEYQDLGWEVMDFDTEFSGTAETFFAYLRKKKVK